MESNAFKLALMMASMVIMAAGQITFEPGSNDLICPESGGAFCIGDSFSTPLFAKCTSHGIDLFDCNQILADFEPYGKKDDAVCYQVSPSAGNATCYWHGKLYEPDPVSIALTLEERVVNHVKNIVPDTEAAYAVADEDVDAECLVPEDDEEPLATSSITISLDTHTVTEIETPVDVQTEPSSIAGVTQYPGLVESSAGTDLESSAVEPSAIESSARASASDPDREVDLPTITRSIITAAATESSPSDVAALTNIAPPATRSFIFTKNTDFHASTGGVLTGFLPVSFETSTVTLAGPQTSTVIVVVGGGSHSNASVAISTPTPTFIPDSSNSMKHGPDLAFVVLCLVILAVM